MGWIGWGRQGRAGLGEVGQRWANVRTSWMEEGVGWIRVEQVEVGVSSSSNKRALEQ